MDPAKENEGFAGVVAGAAPGVPPPVLKGELLPPPNKPAPLPLEPPLPAVAPPNRDGCDAFDEAGVPAPPNKPVPEAPGVVDGLWPALAPKRPPGLAAGLFPVLLPNKLLPDALLLAPPNSEPELAPPKLNFGGSLDASLDMAG